MNDAKLDAMEATGEDISPICTFTSKNNNFIIDEHGVFHFFIHDSVAVTFKVITPTVNNDTLLTARTPDLKMITIEGKQYMVAPEVLDAIKAMHEAIQFSADAYDCDSDVRDIVSNAYTVSCIAKNVLSLVLIP